MKIKTLFALAIIFLPAIGSAAERHTGKIRVMQSPSADRPCLFFQLEGVHEADPILPDNPWFAVHEGTHYYIEIAGMLTAAYHDEKPLTVETTGQLINDCQHAGVKYVRY